jgi:ribosomal protein S18 acetylase RimI-like enzyme
MTNAVLDTGLLEPADWRLLRDTRLRALSDSPGAFVSRYRRECRMSDECWRQRLHTVAWVAAREHGRDVIGMAGLIGDHPEEPEHVESIWVAPTRRNRGVFRSVLARVAEIARDAQLSDLWLWVLEDNPLAWRVYVRSGFVWTGERKLVDPGHDRLERHMRLTI